MDFSQIAALTIFAGVFAIAAKSLKQPLVVGYLVAGFFLSYFGIVSDHTQLETLGKIGVALLLFLLGMEIDINEIPALGKVALIAGTTQIIATFLAGYLFASLLGFGLVASAYIGISLTFSSTIIIVKLLSEKRELNSLHGRISIGILLMQDLVAISLLMFLSGLGGGIGLDGIGLTLIKGLTLIFGVFLLSKKVMPYAFEKIIADSRELIFIVSLAWAFGFTALVAGPFGFTLEIGGFLAGLSLSNLPEHLQVASKTRSLQEFFLIIFFLLLGQSLVFGGNILSLVPKASLFSLFVLIGNPLIILFILKFLGYRKRTSFLAAISLTQISEFSLVLVATGLSLGHIQPGEVALVVLIGMITITISTYFISSSGKIYKILSKYLNFFEGKRGREAPLITETRMEGHLVIVGADKTGLSVIKYFAKSDNPFVVVDFNPEIFKKLTAENIKVVFGDITDIEILEAANIHKSRLVISTIPKLEDNLVLLEYLKGRKVSEDQTVIVIAQTPKDGLKLYEAGASYVIVPDIVAGEHIIHLLETYGRSGKRLGEMGKSHFNRLVFT